MSTNILESQNGLTTQQEKILEGMAFPAVISTIDKITGIQTNEIACGLSRREYFAAIAMQGMAANGFFQMNSGEIDPRTRSAVFTAVQMADALIEALQVPK